MVTCVRDLIQMDLGCELLVLSACETSQGKQVEFEDASSLARAGLVAGATAVLSTLWKVSDRDSRDFIIEFYRKWIQEGRTRVAALAEAKRAALRAGRPPSSWAPFVLWDGVVKR